MNRMEYLLTQGGSECNEVAHRVSKALHFGLDETQAGCTRTNAERIVDEYIDLLAVMEMLEDEGHIRMPADAELTRRKQEKKAKVEKFLVYARDVCKTVQG